MMRRLGGFTLVELIVVITLTGIVATLVAIPLRQPVLSFVDTSRRVAMSDIVDNALRRVARETHNGLPNSLRQPFPGASCIEFLPTLGGGRYRTASSAGDVLDFAAADSSFDTLAYAGASTLPSGARVVIYNLGVTDDDAYALDNVATVQSYTGGKITLAAAKKFPFESPGKRFHLIGSQSVVFACDGAAVSGQDGAGRLVRYVRDIGSGLAALTSCPATAPSGAAVLAEKVSSCNFSYAPGVLQREGVLLMQLAVQQEGESVKLFHETHINNVP